MSGPATLGNINVAINSTDEVTPVTRQLTHDNNGTGRVLLWVIAFENIQSNSTTDITATYNDVDMVEVGRSETPGYRDDIPLIILFELENPATGLNNFSVSIELGAGGQIRATALIGVSVNGEGGTGDINQAASDASVSSINAPITTTAPDSLVLGLIGVQDGTKSPLTAGSGYTPRSNTATGGATNADCSFLLQSQQVASIGTVDCDASWTGTDDCSVLAIELLASSTVITGAHVLPAPTQSADVDVLAAATAAHTLPAPTQAATVEAIAEVNAVHSLPAPTQTAQGRAIAGVSAAQSLPAPTQTAALDVIDVAKITAAHRLPAPMMAASIRSGERQAIALVGSLPGSINLQGSLPAISLTGSIPN